MTITPQAPLTPSELALHNRFPQYSQTTKYYVYRHNDFDGRCLYVGKGCGKRAWHVTKRDPAHKAWIETCKHDYVEVIDDCLTELQAFRLENQLLREEAPRFNKIQNH
ncbi:excinuclease ABC subunit C [Thalassobium sp. R2A62]|jgi:hypothetical protein|uniref:excinuclease ABC subunit C n=1 Tax=Thalassobium sp. R2A62 TaxID=633131 RepID=UPI0001B1CFF4|nr:excinuclease ABC subunit C [Thalassobium sp. R2A62]EET47979.1 excinuclease ABC subunit C [Thalassobium sp. R2A62]